MKTGRVALLHIAVVPGAIEHNRHTLEQAVRNAAAYGAHWVITPELAVCGIQFAQVIGTNWIRSQPDAWMSRFCQLVKSLKLTVFLSYPERDLGKLYNSVFVISSQGAIIGKHRKVNVAADSLMV
jgi:predicted amidohydrolase